MKPFIRVKLSLMRENGILLSLGELALRIKKNSDLALAELMRVLTTSYKFLYILTLVRHSKK